MGRKKTRRNLYGRCVESEDMVYFLEKTNTRNFVFENMGFE